MRPLRPTFGRIPLFRHSIPHSIPRPRLPLLSARPTLPPRRPISTTDLRARLRSRSFWRAVLGNWKPALKIAGVVNISILLLQGLVHFGLLIAAETSQPTPPSWPLRARYYLLRARMPNAWNPLVERKTDEEMQRMYDRALEAVVGGGGEGAGGGWELVLLRKERGEAQEKLRDWDKAEAEYRAALEVPADAPRLKVEAANRLARIREWRGDAVGALEALEQAVRIAGGPALPTPGDRRNTPELMGAVGEMAVFLARHGEIGRALEMATDVLVRRKTAEAGREVKDPKRYTEAVGDPCRVAVSEATVGELLFAIGKRDEGLRWSEGAFHKAWELVDYRLACKECAGIAAANLVQMGKILEEEALLMEEGKKGWWGGNGRTEKEEKLREAQRIRGEYEIRKMEVEAVKAVKDSDVAQRA
ncbi:hypothetical protein BZA05DRAFT_407651 [Tricharina praecox]|uniref:uncharacterized protein n=1 Tax=Tricharina praecox TaxID=43433 RepID=UPI002220FD12|nr:uncharacterized protein BZA05DRAFT_407651 [Tricharina praecox]KAI5846001.1 hypothetical protein BZA05DRAFT_407651 [Tricharina praecox]